MKITKLAIKQLRALSNVRLDFDADIIFLTGNNGSGKSTCIEAISLACQGSSFRSNTLTDLISLQNPEIVTRIYVSLRDELGEERRLEYATDGRKKKTLLDGLEATPRALSKLVRFTVFDASSSLLVSGGPEYRRSFIDEALVHAAPGYAASLRDYRRALAQRNALLEQAAAPSSRALWDEQLQALSSVLRNERKAYIAAVAPQLSQIMSSLLTMPITLEFTYRESILDERKVAGELALGRTLFGAHLDDINLIFKASSGNRSSRTQLSRGQQALLAAVWRITALTQGPPCILALDDVVGELDAQKLIDFIFYAVPTHAHQLIIAVPDISAAFIQKISERGMNVQKYRLGD